MPYSNLEILKAVDAQLAALDKIVKGGDYYGAGLDVTLQVLRRVDADASDDDDDDAAPPTSLRMELTHDVDVLMALLRKSLVARREIVLAAVQGEANELRDFLAAEEASKS